MRRPISPASAKPTVHRRPRTRSPVPRWRPGAAPPGRPR
jgi:hypothetical protein